MTWKGLPTNIEEVDFSGIPDHIVRVLRPFVARQIDDVLDARLRLHDLVAAGASSNDRRVQMIAVDRCEANLFHSMRGLGRDRCD